MTPFRFVQWNIKGGQLGLDGVASQLEQLDPDAVALHEVFTGQVKHLARSLGRVPIAAPATRFGLKRFGNALLVRERPAEVRRILLSQAKGIERRGLVVARLASGLHLAATHLDLEFEERRRHIVEIMRALEGAQPLVLGGDLNERPEGFAVRRLLERYTDAFAVAGDGDGSTFPADKPVKRIDFVLCSRGMAIERVWSPPTERSDHLPVVAELLL